MGVFRELSQGITENLLQNFKNVRRFSIFLLHFDLFSPTKQLQISLFLGVTVVFYFDGICKCLKLSYKC